MSLNDTAIIANPRFKIWSARKIDKEATIELCQEKHAEHGSVRVNKTLLPNEPKLKAIRKLTGQARNYHYEHTLPWEERGGGRILPAALYIPYQKQMDKFLANIEKLIDEFCEPQYYEDAINEGLAKLGQLGDRFEYPNPLQIRRQFEAQVSYYPIPDPTDFRVSMGAHEIQQLKAKAAAHEQEVVKRATEHLWTRLSKLAQHAHKKLGDPDAVFHNTLTKNINHFNDIVNELNIGGDQYLTQVARELANGVGSNDVETLRKDQVTRERAAKTAESALEKIQRQMEAFSHADSA